MWLVYIMVLLSFLIGSFPTGYIIVKKYHGFDIRTKGSGNIGSTNVKRVVGGKAATITQVIDIAKGIIPMIIAIVIYLNNKIPIDMYSFLSSVAIAAVLGHNYTPFLGFKGGKGVNTTLGAFIFIAPIPVFLGILVHTLLKKAIPVVAVRSILLGVTIALASILLSLPSPVIYACIASAVIMTIRHKKNIKELLEERRNKR